MRGLRSTIALVVVLAGLGAYIYFVTWKQPTDTPASKLEKVFASVEADKISDLKVKAEAGDTTTLTKDKDGWKLVAPLATGAQESEVSGVTSALSTVEIARVIDENPSNLKEYGLDMPRIEVDFKAAGDKDFRQLRIGAKTPTAGNVFAQRGGDKRVFLIAAYQEGQLNKSTFDLRDKTVVKFDREKVDHITVTADGKTLELAKEGSDWKIVKPLGVAADYSAVEGLIGRVQGAQMKKIVADNAAPADLKKYGFDKPPVTAIFNLGSAAATVLVGGKAEEGTVYARDAAKPLVFTIETGVADDLKKGADDYRRKDIFAFRAYDTDHLEITRGSQTLSFDKVKGQGTAEDSWKRTAPTAGTPDKEKMSVALAKLESMRAQSFVEPSAKTGLDMPVMTVYAKFAEGKKEERASFGKVGDDVFAARQGEPGAAKVNATEFNELSKALDEVAK